MLERELSGLEREEMHSRASLQPSPGEGVKPEVLSFSEPAFHFTQR